MYEYFCGNDTGNLERHPRCAVSHTLDDGSSKTCTSISDNRCCQRHTAGNLAGDIRIMGTDRTVGDMNTHWNPSKFRPETHPEAFKGYFKQLRDFLIEGHKEVTVREVVCRDDDGKVLNDHTGEPLWEPVERTTVRKPIPAWVQKWAHSVFFQCGVTSSGQLEIWLVNVLRALQHQKEVEFTPEELQKITQFLNDFHQQTQQKILALKEG